MSERETPPANDDIMIGMHIALTEVRRLAKEAERRRDGPVEGYLRNVLVPAVERLILREVRRRADSLRPSILGFLTPDSSYRCEKCDTQFHSWTSSTRNFDE